MIGYKNLLFLAPFIVGLLFFNFSQTFAQTTFNDKKYINIVNPIRGKDFWSNNFGILDTPKAQYKIISDKKIPSTWLVRYDALSDKDTVNFLKSFDKNQEIGIFFEVTPTLTRDSKVKYNQSPNWHFAKSVLLIGYSPDDRKKMIDQAFKKFEETLNLKPTSVGAWWIDGGSLAYLRDQYGIEANLDVSDQFSTDQYQVWGQYWSSPFYPSKFNALMPAANEEQKVGVVTIQWAPRDPFNGYGNGVFESTFSLQANDYLLHDLGVDYFEKLVGIYPQITVGLENDFDFKKFGSEYQKQIEALSKTKGISFQTMTSFAKDYQKLFPDISPELLISAMDPLGTGNKVVWFQNKNYRVGWFYGPYGSVIRDLRPLNGSSEENCLKVSCNSLNLAFTSTSSIDDVNFSTKWVIDEGDISDFSILKKGEIVEFSYKNQGGGLRKIKLLPNDIQVDEKIYPISVAILNTVSHNNQDINRPPQIEVKFNWLENLKNIVPGFLKFLGFVVLFFFIPGYLISRRLVLSIPVGISLFVLAAFILGYLKLGILIWVLPAVSFLLLIKDNPPDPSIPKINSQNLPLMVAVGLGSLTWMLTQVKNGLLYNFGYGFWGPNGHDAIWHVSLINQLKENILPQNPIFASEALVNYHYFYDLLLAKTSQLVGINAQDLLFRFYPLLISLLVGFLVYKVAVKISNNHLSGLFATFFVYFGGSFGWIVSYFRDRNFGGETMFWAQQAISTLLNPPFAISIVLLLSGFLIYEHIKEHGLNKWSLISLVLVWGSLIEFKAYGGVLLLAALGLVALESLIFKRKVQDLLVFILCLVVSLLVFLPNNIGGPTLFVLSPLWFVQTMILFPDRLGWYRLNLAQESGVLYKVIAANGIGLLVFLFGNFGTRFFGLLSIFKQRVLFYIFALGLIIPLLFIQKGTNWNSIQFFYYSLVILAIFSGIFFGKFLLRVNQPIKIIITLLIIGLTIPTTLDTLKHYLPERPPAKLSTFEIEGLEFLKKQPNGTVMVLPFDPKLKDKYSEPVPLAAYTSTSYVSAFSGKEVFIEDLINLEILGVDYKGRLNLQRDFSRIPENSKKILKENNISYIYTVKSQNFQEMEEKMGIKNIFENDEVKIFKVL